LLEILFLGLSSHGRAPLVLEVSTHLATSRAFSESRVLRKAAAAKLELSGTQAKLVLGLSMVIETSLTDVRTVLETGTSPDVK
jgi:hypothetical protein